ncbi:UNVERIFIED_CONTAM: Autophagy-related protein 18a [Sesamum angustifolium]|uniref:Autophagy-related protein 18a n=1 Tax=Sesamum angustifolium TaxID=2727405 RepID=A0AAW2NZ90_9LAMI
MVLVCLGSDKGEVRVEVEHYGLSTSRLIKAHNSDVACFALSNDGRLLATASTKGTLVRVFDTSDGRLLQELRRGSEEAEIHSLCFSSDAEWLAVSSNKGTIHVFSLDTGSGSSVTDGSQEAEQKIVLFRIFPPSKVFCPSISVPSGQWLSFGFYRCKFDPIAGGEMTQMDCRNFLQPLDSDYIIV